MTVQIPQIDAVDLANRIFNVACTLQTLLAALPDDRPEDEVPVSFMVSMCSRMAHRLAEEVLEYPHTLVASPEVAREAQS